MFIIFILSLSNLKNLSTYSNNHSPDSLKMYCGGKKYSPSSSHASIISRVFQVSWFPKFNQKSSNPETKSAKNQRRDKPDFPTPTPPLPAFKKEPRFYSVDEDDDDEYWRLSFREQRSEDRKSITGITPLSSDSDVKFQIPVSSFTSFGSREMKEKQYKEHVMRKHDPCRTKKQNGEEKLATPRKKDRRSRIMSRRQPGDGELKSSKPVEKDIFPVETGNKVQMKEGFQDSAVYNSENQQNISSRNFSLSSVEEDYAFGRVSISEWQNLDKINYKTEFQRKSHCRKIKEKNWANNYSPKKELRIRVLEEMKKEKMRLKKKETKERVAEGGTIYDSFAEVKTSFNQQQDFRDSMVEMISEKGIRRPEELEDLLACYLTLNCDEYHDLIVKVFQQVWFELSSGVY